MNSQNLIKVFSIVVSFQFLFMPITSFATKKNGLDEFMNQSMSESLDSWHGFEKEQKIERYQLKDVTPTKAKTKVTLEEGAETLVVPSLEEIEGPKKIAKQPKVKPSKMAADQELERLASEEIP